MRKAASCTQPLQLNLLPVAARNSRLFAIILYKRILGENSFFTTINSAQVSIKSWGLPIKHTPNAGRACYFMVGLFALHACPEGLPSGVTAAIPKPSLTFKWGLCSVKVWLILKG
jgi:hypothetical protein